jgi:hypothetical protein
MEPEYWFVRDAGSGSAHHWDYIRNRSTIALCGHAFSEIASQGPDRPKRVCRACQELLPVYHAQWWREAAEETSELVESLREHAAKLQQKIDDQRTQLQRVQTALARLKQANASKSQPKKKRRSDVREYWDKDRAKDARIDQKPKRAWLGNATTVRSVTSGGLPGHGKAH